MLCDLWERENCGQLQPFELVIAIMIADLAAVPMADIGVPLFYGIIPIIALLLMQLIISNVNLKSIWARQVVCGKPSILIYRGKIDETALKKEKLTINELQERLREKDVFSLGDVEFAILETSGQITVIQKPEKRNTRPEDLSIMPDYEGVPYDLITDGRVMEKNLQAIGKDYKWLEKEVKKFGITPDDALIVTYDGKGQIFCQEKHKD